MMKKKPSSLKDILFVSISSFVVVAAWVGFNIYHSYVTTTITPELQIQIESIHPDFDTATIQNLKLRKQVIPVTKLSNKANAIPTPSVVPTQEQQLTPVPSLAPENDIPVTVQGE